MNNYASVTITIDNFYSKTKIDSTLSDYITSTQIGASYYTKSEIDTTLSLYSPSAQILSKPTGSPLAPGGRPPSPRPARLPAGGLWGGYPRAGRTP